MFNLKQWKNKIAPRSGKAEAQGKEREHEKMKIVLEIDGKKLTEAVFGANRDKPED